MKTRCLLLCLSLWAIWSVNGQTPGSVDRAFTTPCIDGTVSAILVNPDRTILVAGTFVCPRGAAVPGIARLQAEGNADSGWRDSVRTGDWTTGSNRSCVIT